MAIHFSVDELRERRDRCCVQMRHLQLDGMLIFRQESMYYLTGYDTFGYCFFQCLFLGADGSMALLTRAPDLRQAQHTSVIEDIRIWVDAEGRNAAIDLRVMLQEFGCTGQQLGIELEAYGLTAGNWRRVEAALEGFCSLTDASGLVTQLRMIKSPAELDYVRQSARLADDALDAAIGEVRPGAFEGDILAAMHGAIFKGGGDYAGNEFIIGAGQDALLCRYFSGRKHLGQQDQLTLEWAGVWRHYHAAMMRTIAIGSATDEHRKMHAACVRAQDACHEQLFPGNTVGAVFDAHAREFDAAGYAAHRLNACGYSLGTTFTPTWMDSPMLYTGSPLLLESGMVFFLHMVLMNSDTEKAMSLGHTVVVSETGPEILSRHSGELLEL